jgi:flagellar protein FliS
MVTGPAGGSRAIAGRRPWKIFSFSVTIFLNKKNRIPIKKGKPISVSGGTILAYQNALSTYRETRIKTASQGQLIIMLYDEAIKTLDRGLELLAAHNRKKNPSNIEKIGKSVMKAQEIITELTVSLDFEQGGDIARNLFSLYTWFNQELLEANIRLDIQRMTVVRDMMNELRGAWNGIIGTNAAEGAGRAAGGAVSGVNIAG